MGDNKWRNKFDFMVGIEVIFILLLFIEEMLSFFFGEMFFVQGYVFMVYYVFIMFDFVLLQCYFVDIYFFDILYIVLLVGLLDNQLFVSLSGKKYILDIEVMY